MDLSLILYLFLLTVFLTITFSVFLKNRGPWNNPIFFFLMLFLTSWSISLWFGHVTIRNRPYPFLSITGIPIIISVLLAAAKPSQTGRDKMRRIEESRPVEVVTKIKYRTGWTSPNIYYWGLILFESLLIIAAYSWKFFEPTP